MNRKWSWFSLALLAALLLGGAGCGGISGSVPVSPMMFMHNDAPRTPAQDVPSLPATTLAQAQ